MNLANTSRLLAVLIAGSALPLGAQTIIESFSGYADTAALSSIVSNPTNATITLNATAGVDGGNALVFTGNNGVDPFFSRFDLNVPDFSLAGTTSVTLSIKFLSGSNENLFIRLRNGSTTVLQGANVATQSISGSSFNTYTFNTTGLSSTVTALQFVYGANNYGSTSVIFDNIAVTSAIPEPSSSAALVAGACAVFVGLRSRRRRLPAA